MRKCVLINNNQCRLNSRNPIWKVCVRTEHDMFCESLVHLTIGFKRYKHVYRKQNAHEKTSQHTSPAKPGQTNPSMEPFDEIVLMCCTVHGIHSFLPVQQYQTIVFKQVAYHVRIYALTHRTMIIIHGLFAHLSHPRTRQAAPFFYTNTITHASRVREDLDHNYIWIGSRSFPFESIMHHRSIDNISCRRGWRTTATKKTDGSEK